MVEIREYLRTYIIPDLADAIFDYILNPQLAIVIAVQLIGTNRDNEFKKYIKLFESRKLHSETMVSECIGYCNLIGNKQLADWCKLYFCDGLGYKFTFRSDEIPFLPSKQDLKYDLDNFNTKDLRSMISKNASNQNNWWTANCIKSPNLHILVLQYMLERGIDIDLGDKIYSTYLIHYMIKWIKPSDIQSLVELFHSNYNKIQYPPYTGEVNMRYNYYIESYVTPLSSQLLMLQLYFDIGIKTCLMGHSIPLKEDECSGCINLRLSLGYIKEAKICMYAPSNTEDSQCSNPSLPGWHRCKDCFAEEYNDRSYALKQIAAIPSITLNAQMVIGGVLHGLIIDNNGNPLWWGLPNYDIKCDINPDDYNEIVRLLRSQF